MANRTADMGSSAAGGASKSREGRSTTHRAPRGGDRRRQGIALARFAGFAAIAVMAAISVYAWLASRGFESTEDAFVEGTLVYLAPEIRIARAEANLAAARNRLISAEAAAASADAEGKAATVERWRTGRELDRAASLASRGAANDQQLDTARAAHDAAEATVKALSLRAEAERGVLGSEAPVRQAEAELRDAQLSLDRTVLVAPFDAVVGRKNVEPGDIVKIGESLIALAKIEPRWIVANFKETRLERMRVGQPVLVEVDARDGVVFHGHVDSFSPASGAKYALIPPEQAVSPSTA